MLTTIRYVLLTAVRDRIFIGLLVLLCMALGVASFLGDTALVEKTEMSSTYFAASARIILMIGLTIFVCFHVRRAFDHREMEYMLTKPISRPVFVFAYWLGFVVVALLLVLPVLLILGLMLQVDTSGLVLWGVSLIQEALFVVAFGLFSSLILKSAVSSVLFCFTIYFLSRMLGFFLYMLEKPYLFSGFDLGFITEKILYLTSALLPRLDLFGKSEWLVYGAQQWEAMWLFSVQTAIYVPLLLLMSIFDFRRRQF